jgi:hypothetical protein
MASLPPSRLCSGAAGSRPFPDLNRRQPAAVCHSAGTNNSGLHLYDLEGWAESPHFAGVVRSAVFKMMETGVGPYKRSTNHGPAAFAQQECPVIAALIGVGVLATTATTPLWPIEIHSLRKVIKNEAARLAQPHVKVEEFVAGRRSMRGDVTGDGRDDLIVLFTLERGDLWVQYLAAISSAGVPLATAEVARKGVRAVDLDRTSGTLIQLTTKRYAPGDAACCPSLLQPATYALRSRHLKELKPPSTAAARAAPPTTRRPHHRH